jgi:rhodanese-related sulfurtransferase
MARFMNRGAAPSREHEADGRSAPPATDDCVSGARLRTAAVTRPAIPASTLGWLNLKRSIDVPHRQMTTIVAIVVALASVQNARAQHPQESAGPVAIPRLKLDDFRARHASGSILVVDVRDELSFKAGHIPGAISVPLTAIVQRANEVRDLAGRRPVVTYCSCPSEQTAASAAVALAKHGVTNVSVLVGGYPEWVATGGAVERGT